MQCAFTGGEPRVRDFNHGNEYVHQALRSGASRFLLKDAEPEQLIAAVRTVARGEALVASEVTRKLIGRYSARVRPADPEAVASGQFTPRELDVLKLVAAGISNAEIAGTLVIGKLDLRDRVQAVVYAYRSGLVRPGD